MSSSREIIKKIERDDWYLVKVVGSHHHFKHPTKTGKITVPHQKKIYLVALNVQSSSKQDFKSPLAISYYFGDIIL